MEGESKTLNRSMDSVDENDNTMGDENDTVNLPDMEQDTMDLNIQEQNTENRAVAIAYEDDETVGEDDNEDEDEDDDEMLEVSEIHSVMQELMNHFDNEVDMDTLREMLDESKHTRTYIQQAQREPRQTIRGKWSRQPQHIVFFFSFSPPTSWLAVVVSPTLFWS